mmetsp:Transcript_11390/g.19108  ORF Transcript_11390/g.19108 Transcript_11390/m.19108 type:complete len:251 (+) Transcript_11390:333-1085(+)
MIFDGMMPWLRRLNSLSSLSMAVLSTSTGSARDEHSATCAQYCPIMPSIEATTASTDGSFEKLLLLLLLLILLLLLFLPPMARLLWVPQLLLVAQKITSRQWSSSAGLMLPMLPRLRWCQPVPIQQLWRLWAWEQQQQQLQYRRRRRALLPVRVQMVAWSPGDAQLRTRRQWLVTWRRCRNMRLLAVMVAVLVPVVGSSRTNMDPTASMHVNTDLPPVGVPQPPVGRGRMTEEGRLTTSPTTTKSLCRAP